MDKTVSRKLDSFFEKYTTLKYQRGEMIVRAGDPPPGVFYLKKGYVRQYVISQTGEMLIVHIFRPGAFFPMYWAINDTPNSFYFDALTPIEMVRAPKEAVRQFLEDEPKVLYSLTSRLLMGLTGVLGRMEYLVFAPAYKKVVSLLLYHAKLFGEPGATNGDVRIGVPLTHKDIAAWIGTTRETASLQVEALGRKGIVRYKGRQLIITKPRALEDELLADAQ